MKPRFQIRAVNSKMIVILFILLTLYSCAFSQGRQRIHERGYEIGLGLHNFVWKGDGYKISNLVPSATGISLGYFCGNNLLKMRVRGLGYYGAAGALQNTFDQYEGDLLLNFYPMEFARTSKNTIDLYLATGFNYTYAAYHDRQSAFLKDSFQRLSNLWGIGVEALARRESKVMRLFAEIHVGSAFHTGNHANDSSGPIPKTISAINIGVRVGFQKMYRPHQSIGKN